MIRRLGFLFVFLSLFSIGIVGCGDPGGAEGDTNDPAASGDDEEQMEDETGEEEGADDDGGGEDDGAGEV